MINLWVLMSTTARDAINERLDWDRGKQGKYAPGIKEAEARIFNTMADRVIVQNMFRTATFIGKSWVLYSLYLDDLQSALDFLAENRPGHYRVMGAWEWDGRQLGTEWELDDEGNRAGGITGTPAYPIPKARLLQILPTIKAYDEDGILTGETEPIELTDVNLLQGQQPRHW